MSSRDRHDRRFHRDRRSPERRKSLDDSRKKPAGYGNHRDRSPAGRRSRHEEDRRYRNYPSSRSRSHSSRRRRQRRNRSGYDEYSGDDGRKRRRRHRSAERRRSSDRGRHRSSPDGKQGGRSSSRRRGSPPSQRHRNERGGGDAQTDRYRRRRRRHSSSPQENRRRGRRRRRRQERRSYSSNSARPLPVANDAAPRAGVVSDDDPPSFKKRSPSSSHDDTVGHFKGREGTIIADRFRIIKEVGLGTFGRVVGCLDLKRVRSSRRDHQENIVAIKIVRNVKRYYESALIEADIIEDVNKRGGRGVSHCAVMYDAFSFMGHYCMVFESLGPSLYDFLKRQNYQPFPLPCVRDFAQQLLETLEFLHSFRLIHTDLKPENILLLNDREANYKGYNIPECTRIKVIDFGGATYDNEKKSSVVNTRQYRAPEVILGVGWSMPSDLWSVGCILTELYQGELLFATHDNIEHLALIEQVIGPFPRRMLKKAKNEQLASQAFDSAGAHRMERVLAPESLAYVKRVGPLESIIYEEDTWFLRLLRRILVTDPDERATARECLRKF